LSVSDRRLKANIRNLESTLTGRNLDELRPVSFQYLKEDDTRLGFVANELQRTLPELVREMPDGKDKRLGVVYQDLMAVLTTMIQGLVTEASVLQPRMRSIEERIKQRHHNHVTACCMSNLQDYLKQVLFRQQRLIQLP